MAKNRVSLSFGTFTDGDLGPFALSTVAGMTGNAGFPTPRVTMPNMTTAANVFIADLAAAEGGGVLATATKNASRLELEQLLSSQAAYVQSIAATDLPLLLSSGFQAVSNNRTQIMLPQANIRTMTNVQNHKLGLTLDPLPTARGYEVRYKWANGEYVPVGVFTSSRGILLEGLTPGVVYTVQARGIGGLTGYGDWSDPTSRMAT